MPCQKKRIAQELCQEHEVSISRACRILNLYRSVYHYASDNDDQRVREALERQVVEHPREGFCKTYERLRSEGNTWNHKKVYRVYRAMGLAIRGQAKDKPILRVREMLQLPPEANHTWSLDFARPDDWQRKLIDFRTFLLMDEHSREALHVEAVGTLRSERIVQVLDILSQSRQRPRQVRVDRDPELEWEALEEWGRSNGVEIILADLETHREYAFLEKLRTAFSREVLEAYGFYSLDSVREAADAWVQSYNLRQNRALEGLSPSQYAQSRRRLGNRFYQASYYYAEKHGDEGTGSRAR